MSLVGRKYSQALLEVAKEKGKTDEIYNQFKSIIEALDSKEKMWEILMLPSVESDEKKNIFENLFKDKIDGFLYSLLMISVDKNRVADLKNIFESFKDLYFVENNMVEATVVSAVALEENDIKRLKEKLEKKYKKTVIIQSRIDLDIIGGLIVYVGDQVIDGSIRRKVAMLKNDLKEIRLQELGVN
jgi:F-type H+-transporting ATPase subunit delta